MSREKSTLMQIPFLCFQFNVEKKQEEVFSDVFWAVNIFSGSGPEKIQSVSHPFSVCPSSK